MSQAEKEPIELVRYGAPNIHDKQPYGTRVISYKDDATKYDLWVQLGNNEDEPHWEYMGEFRTKDKHINAPLENPVCSSQHTGKAYSEE